MKKTLLLLIIVAMAFAVACKKNDTNDPVDQGWADKLLIVNEGPFPTGTGSITSYDRETGQLTQDLYFTVNGTPLGNIVQSIGEYNGRFYISVNNANKVEVVNAASFSSTGTIKDITLPRYFVGLDQDKGYVSCWDNTVKVVDLASLAVSKSITVGTGPEIMALAGDLWVINGGGFGVDSTISIIDTETDEVVRTITTGHVPSGLVVDGQGNVWVLCAGRGWNGFPAADDTPGKLVCYDPQSFQVIKQFDFPSSDLHPDNLVLNTEDQVLYFNHPNGIYAYQIGSVELPQSPLVPKSGMFYGIGYDPVSDVVMGTDPKDFIQQGWAYFFDPLSGQALDSIQTGIVPSGFWTGN